MFTALHIITEAWWVSHRCFLKWIVMTLNLHCYIVNFLSVNSSLDWTQSSLPLTSAHCPYFTLFRQPRRSLSLPSSKASWKLEDVIHYPLRETSFNLHTHDTFLELLTCTQICPVLPHFLHKCGGQDKSPEDRHSLDWWAPHSITLKLEQTKIIYYKLKLCHFNIWPSTTDSNKLQYMLRQK